MPTSMVLSIVALIAAVAPPPPLKAPGPAPGDFFGNTMALSGDDLVTSFVARPPALKGRVFSVSLARDEPVVQGQLASNFYGDGYGSAIAGEGNLVVVGAPLRRSTAIATDLLRGRLHLLKRQTSGTLSEVSFVSGPAARAELGAAVGMSQGRVVAGLPGVRPATAPPDDRRGQVRFYTVNGIVLTLASTIEFPSEIPVRNFGQVVTMSGDWAAASANVVGGANGNSGVVALMQRQANDTWSIAGTLQAPLPVGGDRFGLTLAMRGDVLVVGAPSPGLSGDGARGAIYVYRLDGAAWNLEAALESPLDGYCEGFGRSVAIEPGGELIAVGALASGSIESGGAAVFLFAHGGGGSQGGWSAAEVRTGLAAHDFGAALEFHNGRLVIGVPGAPGSQGEAEGEIMFVPLPLADVDGDGVVGGGDITVALGAWGPAAPGEAADLNGDGVVDGADLTAILGNWGAP